MLYNISIESGYTKPYIYAKVAASRNADQVAKQDVKEMKTCVMKSKIGMNAEKSQAIAIGGTLKKRLKQDKELTVEGRPIELKNKLKYL